MLRSDQILATVEMIQKSSGINIFDFKRRGLL